MPNTNHYFTINHSAQLKNTIQRSRFVASIREIENELNGRVFLKEVIQQFPGATHHCWAYRLGKGSEEVVQYSDAGEPSNSAGPPILQAIRQAGVTNVMVVVCRYFGGIKLGISGLIQAYRTTALTVLQLAGKVRKYPLREIVLTNVDYPFLGAVLQLIEIHKGRIDAIQYGEKVKIILYLSDSLQEWIAEMLQNITQGKAQIQIGDIRWYPDERKL